MSDIANVLLKVLDAANPLAGAAATFIAGKLGLADSSVSAVGDAVSKMTASSADKVKLEQIAADLKDHLAQYNVQLQTVQLQSAAQQVDSVNKTLQTEAMGGSFWQRNHHAFESSFVCILVAGIYIGLPLAKVPVPQVDPTVWLMLGGILGVTAWQRGQANVVTAQSSS